MASPFAQRMLNFWDKMFLLLLPNHSKLPQQSLRMLPAISIEDGVDPGFR